MDVFLYGQVDDLKLAAFHSLMISITGNGAKQFAHHELHWRPTHQTPFGPARNDDITLVLKSEMINKGEYIKWKQRSWQLIQRNQPEPPLAGAKVANRQIVHAAALNGNPLSFISDLGYSLAFEVVSKGFIYEFSNGIQVLCFQVYKVAIVYLMRRSISNTR